MTSSNIGLIAVGIDRSTLPAYTGSDTPAGGTTISEKKITSPLRLNGGAITIERCWIQPTSLMDGHLIVTYANAGNTTPGVVTIRDCEIDGSAMTDQVVAYACAFHGCGVLQRNYIHDVGSGIAILNTGPSLNATMERNLVTALRAFGDPDTTGSHNESGTVREFDTASTPSRTCTWTDNRLEAYSGNDTASLFIQTIQSDINNVTLTGNYFNGGAWALGLENGFGNDYGTNMHCTNNRFTNVVFGNAYVDDHGTLGYGWATWANNYLNDSGQPDNQGSAVSDPSP